MAIGGRAGLLGGDLPLALGGGGALGVPPADVDVVVDRVPLWLAIDQNNPYQRQTAQFQRQQIDQQPEAGEQSLAGWWTRSQMTWHMGAGLDYLDTTARPDPSDRLRFKTSYNVDCWTPGVLKRLNTVSSLYALSNSVRSWIEPFGQTGQVWATDTTVMVAADGLNLVSRTLGTANPLRAFCTDGANFYFATIDGVWKAPIAGTATPTKVWTLPGTDLPMQLGWSKQRLMLGLGPSVYVLDGAGPTLPAAKYTHPVSSWQWSSFCDCPDGILATGYVGSQSAVVKFELVTVADAPTLGAGTVLLSMPGGEIILDTLAYLGSLLILGTNRGIRVCPFDSYYGTVSLGPLTVQTDAPVTSVGGYDRFVFGGTQTNGGVSLVRVDLSAPLDNVGHYAWAPDLPLPTTANGEVSNPGPIMAISFQPNGLKYLATTGPSQGLRIETAVPNNLPAWLQTARIRMGTVEDKHFVHATVRGQYNAARPVATWVQTPTTDFTLTHTSTTTSDRFGLGVTNAEWIALRLYLNGYDAQVSSYQVQALPAGKRQRLLSLPVWITDYQLTRSGVEVGYPGWGLERMEALESLETIGAEITLSAPALFPDVVVGTIESLGYQQTHDPQDRGNGTGGVLQLLFRTTG